MCLAAHWISEAQNAESRTLFAPHSLPALRLAGLVGGSVPVQDECILSLGRMDKVLSFDPVWLSGR